MVILVAQLVTHSTAGYLSLVMWKVDREPMHKPSGNFWRNHLETFHHKELSIDLEELPMLCELEAACRSVAAGKASGLDGIPSEICKYCPTVTALHLYSLMLTICTQGQEALSHKGGILPIWKGKQDKASCSAYRSILLSSNLVKVMHKTIRTKQRGCTKHSCMDSRLGAELVFQLFSAGIKSELFNEFAP